MNDTGDNAFVIAALRLELAETIAQRDELASMNQRLLESQRRVYVATKPVLDAVKVLCADRWNAESVERVCTAYNAYNPPRELEVYK